MHTLLLHDYPEHIKNMNWFVAIAPSTKGRTGLNTLCGAYTNTNNIPHSQQPVRQFTLSHIHIKQTERNTIVAGKYLSATVIKKTCLQCSTRSNQEVLQSNFKIMK